MQYIITIILPCIQLEFNQTFYSRIGACLCHILFFSTDICVLQLLPFCVIAWTWLYYRLLTLYGENIDGLRYLDLRVPRLRDIVAKNLGPTMISLYTVNNHFIAYFDIVIT